ncbi:hypothetical protein N6H18_17830 [Reichenbachiella agarivorans]|uniref:Uncharacterized protein n=1 Tax=Reichenbachiella agarivorans TaxID=2979464 RepID=A0ABY6CNZ1_9BACT|nr:hypothetical protein [Reichenbachiella agarivorans]UXP32202.1 hypothetical protein N6H18_17830 [Reichenbachiella agarivorans]
MNQGFIKIEKSVTKHAKEAYEKHNYIEAEQVLHYWIESQLHEQLILSGCIDQDGEMLKVWKQASTTDLLTAARVLHLHNQISKTQYQKITQFNELRTRVTHLLFYDPLDRTYQGVPKETYDEMFKLGMELARKYESQN